jgi:hypothetical protein
MLCVSKLEGVLWQTQAQVPWVKLVDDFLICVCMLLLSSWVPPLSPLSRFLGPACPVVVPRCLACLVLLCPSVSRLSSSISHCSPSTCRLAAAANALSGTNLLLLPDCICRSRSNRTNTSSVKSRV